MTRTQASVISRNLCLIHSSRTSRRKRRRHPGPGLGCGRMMHTAASMVKPLAARSALARASWGGGGQGARPRGKDRPQAYDEPLFDLFWKEALDGVSRTFEGRPPGAANLLVATYGHRDPGLQRAGRLQPLEVRSHEGAHQEGQPAFRRDRATELEEAHAEERAP